MSTDRSNVFIVTDRTRTPARVHLWTVVQLGRLLDRLPPGVYVVTFKKSESDGIHPRLEIVRSEQLSRRSPKRPGRAIGPPGHGR